MTPEERFARIEKTLNTIAENQAGFEGHLSTHDTTLSRLEAGMDRLEGNLERLEVAMELSFHEQNPKIQKLTEFQTALMESQNGTWRAIDALTRNVDRLIRFQGDNGGHP